MLSKNHERSSGSGRGSGMFRTLITGFCALVCLSCLSLPVTAQGWGELFSGVKSMMHPPVVIELEHPPTHWLQVEQIAFAEVKGKCAEEMAALLREFFVKKGVTIVDRNHLKTVLAEQGLVASGLVNPETAIQLRQIIGATTLIVLEVQRCQDEPRTWTKRSQTKQGTKTSYYSETTTYIKGAVQIVDLETTQVFSSEVFQASYSEKAGPANQRIDPPAAYPIHDQALQSASGEVARLLFTWEQPIELPFFNPKKCGLKDVYRRLEIGDFTGAEELAVAAVAECRGRKAELQAKSEYDLGITRMLLDDYPLALENFESAYSTEPRKDFLEAVQAARSGIDATERLEGYWRFLEEGGDPGGLLVQQAIQNSKDSTSGDAMERLAELKELLEAGLISEEDYDEKKEEILAGI